MSPVPSASPVLVQGPAPAQGDTNYGWVAALVVIPIAAIVASGATFLYCRRRCVWARRSGVVSVRGFGRKQVEVCLLLQGAAAICLSRARPLLIQ